MMEFKKATCIHCFRSLLKQARKEANKKENQRTGISYNHLTTRHYCREKEKKCSIFFSLNVEAAMRKCVHELILEAVHPFLRFIFFRAFNVEQHIYGFVIYSETQKILQSGNSSDLRQFSTTNLKRPSEMVIFTLSK